MSRVLVTGVAGFIGFHLAKRLLDRGDTVAGLDNLSDYYDVGLKRARLAILGKHAGFSFHQLDLVDRVGTDRLFADVHFNSVVNLAAQAGVRHSVTHPHVYAQSNVVGFLNVLEACRHHPVDHLVFASSSSVYGGSSKVPFSVRDPADHPLSLYAATKRAGELMAHAYSNLYGIPTTGLRFFTVYGPWDRPDMALFKFTRAILAGEPIDVYNNGEMQRDFTYVDDIVEGVVRVLERPPTPNSAAAGEPLHSGVSAAPYRLYNIGNHRPESLMRYIEVLERSLGRKAQMRMLPMQPGDAPVTCADISDLARDVGFAPSTPITVGIPRYVEWFRDYFRT